MDRLKLKQRTVLIIQDEHLAQMLLHISTAPPTEEVCGLIGAKNKCTTAVYPISNVLHSPNRFLMDARTQLAVILEIERKGWTLAAIYHTHLNGSLFPSETDVAEAYDHSVVNFIWGMQDGCWKYNAFLIRRARIIPMQIISCEMSKDQEPFSKNVV